MNRIDLAEGWDRWWVHVNVITNLQVHEMQGISWSAEDLLDSQ
jgi:hypothetical protein